MTAMGFEAMTDTLSLRRQAGFRQTLAAGFLTLGMAATVSGALLFQHVGGYIPCALCLEQRTPYYIAIPVALLAVVSSLTRFNATLTRALLLIVGLLMLWAFSLAVYHTGVEWRFWAGPTDCTAAAPIDLSGDLLSTLDSVHPPSCADAALRILGLSLAGWNAIAAALFAAVALRSAFAKGDRFA